jgi:hypothetical protein
LMALYPCASAWVNIFSALYEWIILIVLRDGARCPIPHIFWLGKIPTLQESRLDWAKPFL